MNHCPICQRAKVTAQLCPQCWLAAQYGRQQAAHDIETLLGRRGLSAHSPLAAELIGVARGHTLRRVK